MNKLRKSLISNIKIVPKKGQRKLLRSSKDLIRCPFLDYKYIPLLENNVDKAFDILFEEVMKIDYGKE